MAEDYTAFLATKRRSAATPATPSAKTTSTRCCTRGSAASSPGPSSAAGQPCGKPPEPGKPFRKWSGPGCPATGH